LYVAVYECRQCKTRKPEPRWYAMFLGDYPRCPRCGTYRLTRLASRDPIDGMRKGVFSFVQRLLGAGLYHCRYCRLQFYDLRSPVAPEPKERAAAPLAGAGEEV
jgi:DNA-directed RNA polymerase subunit RPC12/RpoP